jgi:hypothetical protein
MKFFLSQMASFNEFQKIEIIRLWVQRGLIALTLHAQVLDSIPSTTNK